MIRYLYGDILEAQAEALVNPVNCKGVMGKGLALQFKKRFPQMYEYYLAMCNNYDVKIGKLCPYQENGIWIVNFPTKDDWREPSRIEYITDGLVALQEWIIDNEINSIAIPRLGCGCGDLTWYEVKDVMENYLWRVSHGVDVQIYSPKGIPFKVKKRYKNPRVIGEGLKPGESSFYGSGRIPAERLRHD